MVTILRAHWSKISSGLLLVTALGVGGVKAYEHFAGSCCEQGASCCHPGASCCNGRHKIAGNDVASPATNN